MLRAFSRLTFFVALGIAFPASSQSAPVSCDLSFVGQSKSHFTFVNGNEDVSAQLSSGYSDLAKGNAFFEQAVRLAQQKNDRCGEALAEYGLAASIDRTRTAEMQQHLQRSVDLFTAINATHALAQAHYALARSLQRDNKTSEAAALTMQAASEFTATGDARGAVAVKVSAVRMGRSSTPEELQALLDETRAAHASASEGSLLHLWGDREFTAGQFASALDRYQQARAVLEQCGCDDPELATVLVSMGRLERVQGQPEQALKDYAIALRLQQASGETEWSIQTMNAMAVAYDALGRRREALAQYQQALEQARKTGAQQFIPFLEGNIGGEYLDMKEYANAAKQLEMVIAKGGSDYLLCFRNNQLAESLKHLGETSQAEAAANNAVLSCRKGKDRDNLADALETRASIATARRQFESALADIHEATGIREEIRSHLVPDDARKQGYNERIQSLYDVSIDLLTRMERSREALEVAEQGRARAFLDLMGSQASASLPTAGHVEIDAPTFASYVSAKAASADDMIEAARHYHSTIVSYWTSGAALYIWVTKSDGTIFETRVRVSRTHLAKLISETASSTNEPTHLSSAARNGKLNARGDQAVKVEPHPSQSWRALYDLLIAPIDRHLPQTRGSLLTIIPHHELFRLSFAALTDSQGEYLVERYALHNVSASALLRYTQQNAQRANALPPHYLLVANPSGVSLAGGLDLPPLPATLTEVNSIAHLLPAKEVTELAGEAALESAVVNALGSATTIHFATHAVLDDADPRNSFLLFYPLPKSKERIRMTTADIYRVKLRANLIVLSACRTGLGKITGDGIDGFSRAFFYAGAASILSTLWDVADEPTAVLVPRFYRELNAGRNRSEALRIAELGLIRQLRAGKVRANTALGPVTLPDDPTFWASFTLSGEP